VKVCEVIKIASEKLDGSAWPGNLKTAFFQ